MDKAFSGSSLCSDTDCDRLWYSVEDKDDNNERYSGRNDSIKGQSGRALQGDRR